MVMILKTSAENHCRYDYYLCHNKTNTVFYYLEFNVKAHLDGGIDVVTFLEASDIDVMALGVHKVQQVSKCH